MKSCLLANELQHVAFCVIRSLWLLDKTNLSLLISLIFVSICLLSLTGWAMNCDGNM